MAAPLSHENPDGFTGGYHATENPPTGAKPPRDTGVPPKDPLIDRAMSQPGEAVCARYPPQARTTAVNLAAIQISRTGPDGLPALPCTVQNSQQRPLNLTHIDPEGRGRTIGQQLDDLLAQAERQSLEEWKTDAR